MAFDASPSWSGFNYQGKVAIYHALMLINAEPVGHDFSTTDLMLEANEDFEIMVNGTSVSFHQVKAYNSSTFEKYSDALFGLTIELHKRADVLGYIHTWKKINDRPECIGLLESVKNDFSIVLKEYKDSEPKMGATIIETAAIGGTNLKKKASILKASLQGLDADELAETIDKIVTQESDALARIASYIYEDGKDFCGLSDINNKIKSQLSTALSNRLIIITDKQLEKAFDYFLGAIDSYIIERHKTKTKTNAPTPIKFEKIINILSFDHEDASKHYIASRFKDRFSQLIDDYLGDEEDYPQPAPELCNLKAASKLLLSLPPLELWEHYRHFSPQLHLDSQNNTDNAFAISDDGIRLYLLKILHEIDFSHLVKEAGRYRFSYRCTTSPQGYMPTTITPVRLSYTIRKLSTNPCLGELLYEIPNLIYCGTEKYPFAPDSDKNTTAPRGADEDTRAKRDDILPLITLLPLEEAKGLLAK